MKDNHLKASNLAFVTLDDSKTFSFLLELYTLEDLSTLHLLFRSTNNAPHQASYVDRYNNIPGGIPQVESWEGKNVRRPYHYLTRVEWALPILISNSSSGFIQKELKRRSSSGGTHSLLLEILILFQWPNWRPWIPNSRTGVNQFKAIWEFKNNW